MRRLPLYPADPKAPIEKGERLDLDDECERCDLHKCKQRSVCISAEGEPDGVLIIQDSPGKAEDAEGRPCRTPTWQLVRSYVEKKYFSGPVAYDTAVRCYPKGKKLTKAQAKKRIGLCRPYLSQTVIDVSPQRIICCGTWAAESVLGRSPHPYSIRRNFSYLSDGTPVFMLPDPSVAFQNGWRKKDFLADLEWALHVTPPTPKWDGVAHIVQSRKDAQKIEKKLASAEYLTFDVETAGAQFDEDFEVLSVAVAPKGSDDAWIWDRSTSPGAWSILETLVSTVPLAGHNIKYDLLCLSIHFRIPLYEFKVYADTLGWRKILDAGAIARLEYCAELVGMGGHKEEADLFMKEAVADIRRNNKRRVLTEQQEYYADCILEGAPTKRYAFGLLDEDVLHRYNALDTVATGYLVDELGAQLEDHAKQRGIWDKIVGPNVEALAQVEAWGIAADRDAVENFHRYCQTIISSIAPQFAAYDLNPGSPDQVARVLFEDAGLQPVKFTNTGKPSTDAGVLESLKGKHPIVDAILEYRKIVKLDGTYAKGMLPHIRDDGRIHPNYNVVGTETGRISCSQPNMQNVPSPSEVEDDHGNVSIDPVSAFARNCFRASPGNTLLQFDYSQLELRIAAILSGDPLMKKIFLDGDDYHTRTAEMIATLAWGIHPDDVKKQHRRGAKCFHPDTEVLTKAGWKKITDLSDGEQVMTCEAKPGFRVDMKWDTPTDVFTARHPDQELIHFKNEGIDIRVTPDHGMLAFTKNGNPQERVLPHEFPNKRYWMNAGVFRGGDLKVKEALLRVAVAVQADGSYAEGSIRFGFKKRRKVSRLRRLLSLAGIAFTESVWSSGTTSICVNSAQSLQIRHLLEGKSLPWSWLDLPEHLRRAVLDEAPYWGHDRDNWNMRRCSSTDPQSIDVLQALASITGMKTRQTAQGKMRVLSIKEHARTRSGNLSVLHHSHTDKVACLTVPSGTVLVRDGGVPLICNQTVNFGLLYGKGIGGLAADLGCSKNEAEKLKDAILGQFTLLSKFISDRLAYGRKYGGVWVPWRKNAAWWRPLPGLDDSKDGVRINAENCTVNTPIQGMASFYCLASIREIIDWIREDHVPAKVVLTVHDSIILDVNPSARDEVMGVVPEIMQGFPSAGVPLVVDCEEGERWGELQKAE